MVINSINRIVTLLAALKPATVQAHCDTAEGPAVKDGRTALQTGNINHALTWIPADGEAELRDVFAVIASDEASHAELAADVASWLAARLSLPARARVATAYRATVDALERSACQPVAEAVRAPMGLPSCEVSRRLFAKARTLLLERTREGLAG